MKNDTVKFILIVTLLPWLVFGAFVFEIYEAGEMKLALIITALISLCLAIICACLYTRPDRVRRKREAAIENARTQAVLQAVLSTGKPVLGTEDENGNFHIKVLEDPE
jgi:hypothetical protein